MATGTAGAAARPSGRPRPPTAIAPHMVSSFPANCGRVVRGSETPAYKHTPHAPTP
ncbi:hypothetical protein GT030_31345 [Streptomyces sp. SID1328]|uniref:hypothetical protein n=1 Tax=Streptomyces sp. SID1328 TaxID=2690250 RepID=UPI0013681A8A|nr:hypothetical protein [Streptomyces sp. SID1328]MYV43227.1 hypothetical protein [Streptomyces sp. SID1328]